MKFSGRSGKSWHEHESFFQTHFMLGRTLILNTPVSPVYLRSLLWINLEKSFLAISSDFLKARGRKSAFNRLPVRAGDAIKLIEPSLTAKPGG